MSKRKIKPIKYESGPVVKTTKAGVIPNQKKLPVVGSGRNRPAKGFNQITKEWSQ